MLTDPFEYGRIHNLPPGVTLNDIDPPGTAICPNCDEYFEDCDCGDELDDEL